MPFDRGKFALWPGVVGYVMGLVFYVLPGSNGYYVLPWSSVVSSDVDVNNECCASSGGLRSRQSSRWSVFFAAFATSGVFRLPATVEG